MRFSLILLCFVAIWAAVEVHSFVQVGSTTPRACVINLRTCRRRRNVCARFGQSQLCERFSTLCDLQSANCQQTAQYTVVNARFCRGLTTGVRGSCSGLNSGVTLGGNLGSGVIIGSSGSSGLLGGSSGVLSGGSTGGLLTGGTVQSPSVIPIVIRG